MTEDDAITFPDEPRGDLDRALIELVERAREVLKTQGRLRALVRANRAVASQLDLPTVLRTIVEAGLELSGARYGALGVLAESGGLEQFIHVGMPPETVEEIGHLPEGHGLLGALIDDPRPIRIPAIGDDPRSVGFPEGHPAMAAFLGVPIRVRDAVYGNLYLTEPEHGTFTPEDEDLITALAATAGYAIDNARLFAETEARRAWSASAAEIASTLLAGEPADALPELVQRVQELARADLALVLVPEAAGGPLRVRVAQGRGCERIDGATDRLRNPFVLSSVEGAQAIRLDDLDEELPGDPAWTAGPALVVPLRGEDGVTGALMALRERGAATFTEFELERAADLAGQAGIAMELASARADRQRMLLLDDRTRIARDLHDHVIQQLFGAGLELQSVGSALGDGLAAERIEGAIGAIDDAIAQIRTIVFALSHDRATGTGLRHRLLGIADELAGGSGGAPALTFAGPVDLVVTGELADDVEAVVREGLTNAVRHSGGQRLSASVEASADSVTVTVQDDGHGMGVVTRRSGLAHLLDRAEARGGSFSIDSDSSGTRLTWSVPAGSRRAR